jgi:hypothetical protein
MLNDAFAVRCPCIDAEGEVSSRRGHVRLFLPQSSFAKDQISANSEARRRTPIGTDGIRPLPPVACRAAFKQEPRPGRGRGLEWDSIRTGVYISRTPVVIAQQFSNLFLWAIALFEADGAAKGLNQCNANVRDNHAQAIAHDRSVVGIVSNVDGGECR